MTLSRNKIIRGADIDGVVFCTPGGGMDSENPVERQEKDNLKTLEEFWRSKGEQQGRKTGFEEGLSQGEQEGYRKGLQEGEAKGFEEGKSQGREEGLEEGKEQVLGQLKETIELLRKGSAELEQQQKLLYDEATPELVRFSLAVCERILRQHLKDQASFVDLLKNLFSQARPIMKEVVVDLFLSEEDYARVQSSFDEFGIDFGEAKQVSLMSDEKLKNGDVRLETPLGLVNFDLERLLSDLEKKTLEAGGSQEEEEIVAAAEEPTGEEIESDSEG